MTTEQYSALIGVMPQIEALLKQQGEKVPRPDYSGDNPADEDSNEEEQEDTKKANIEATSDEEE